QHASLLPSPFPVHLSPSPRSLHSFPTRRSSDLRRAVSNLLTELRPAVLGREATDQAGLDAAMTELDGTENLGRIGANAVLALSLDRKSTRLNSSHVKISYAVFCLKKKTTQQRVR